MQEPYSRQIDLIKILTTYLKETAQSDKELIPNQEGMCYGLSAIHCKYALQGKSKEFANHLDSIERDLGIEVSKFENLIAKLKALALNIEIYEKILVSPEYPPETKPNAVVQLKALRKEVASTKENIEQQKQALIANPSSELSKFIGEVAYSFNPYHFNKNLNQTDGLRAVKVPQSSATGEAIMGTDKYVNKEYQLGLDTSRDNWLGIFDQLQSNVGTAMIVVANGHAVSVSVNANGFEFFDSNKEQIVTAATSKELLTHLESSLWISKEERGYPLAVDVVSNPHVKPAQPYKFPDKEVLFARSSQDKAETFKSAINVQDVQTIRMCCNNSTQKEIFSKAFTATYRPIAFAECLHHINDPKALAQLCEFAIIATNQNQSHIYAMTLKKLSQVPDAAPYLKSIAEARGPRTSYQQDLRTLAKLELSGSKEQLLDAAKYAIENKRENQYQYLFGKLNESPDKKVLLDLANLAKKEQNPQAFKAIIDELKNSPLTLATLKNDTGTIFAMINDEEFQVDKNFDQAVSVAILTHKEVSLKKLLEVQPAPIKLEEYAKFAIESNNRAGFNVVIDKLVGQHNNKNLESVAQYACQKGKPDFLYDLLNKPQNKEQVPELLKAISNQPGSEKMSNQLVTMAMKQDNAELFKQLMSSSYVKSDLANQMHQPHNRAAFFSVAVEKNGKFLPQFLDLINENGITNPIKKEHLATLLNNAAREGDANKVKTILGCAQQVCPEIQDMKKFIKSTDCQKLAAASGNQQCKDVLAEHKNSKENGLLSRVKNVFSNDKTKTGEPAPAAVQANGSSSSKSVDYSAPQRSLASHPKTGSSRLDSEETATMFKQLGAAKNNSTKVSQTNEEPATPVEESERSFGPR